VVGGGRIDEKEDAMTVNVALFNRESNYDMILPPTGFRLRFHPMSQATEVAIEAIKVNEENGFVMHKPMSVKAMILNALSDAKAAHSKGEIETEYLTTTKLSEIAEVRLSTIREACVRLIEEGAIEARYPNASGGKGKVQCWRIKPDKENFSEVH
jgi:hypothetical protein